MGKTKNGAKEAVLAFFQAYLVDRNLEETLDCVTENIIWIGIRESKTVRGRHEVQKVLLDEFSRNPAGYETAFDIMEEEIITEDTAQVFMTGRVTRESISRRVRVMAFCVKSQNRYLISSLHVSVAYDSLEEGEFFPTAGENRKYLEDTVERKILDLFGKSIPGGIVGCYQKPGFPLYFINGRMLEYLGYSYEEFLTETKGMFEPIILPEDRKLVWKNTEEVLHNNQEYQIQYRLKKKDGSFFWANELGKRGIAEDGSEISIGVVRDISEEMAYKNRLEAEAEAKKCQAETYDHLFQSVLCGIVQYQVEGNYIKFIRANQEAIRIFGYTPEEFWAKKSWEINRMVVEEDKEQIFNMIGNLRKVGDSDYYEFQIRQKDGSACWIIGYGEMIRERGGRDVIQGVFLDINERKKAEESNALLTEQVEASNEILQVALEHTTTCEFYYDPLEKLCILPERTRAYYHLAPGYDHMPEQFARECLEEEYQEQFCERYQELNEGRRTISMEYRMKKEGRWCRQTVSVINYTPEGHPSLAIGIIEDLTHQKEIEKELEETRSRDSLTGLYNRESGIRLAKKALENRKPQEHCALMLLDMDDFKEMNRKEGGAFGDAILQDVAEILVSETGKENIQVRLGGDEFMLLIRGCNKKKAGVVGPRIAERVRRIFGHPQKNITVSVSIGMCTTEVVDDYPALYRCAESTLKYVKEHGKGSAACYLDTSNEVGVFLTQMYPGEHPVNLIERDINNQGEDLLSFALELLGKANNLDDAVSLLLARVGKVYGLDRVSILEANRDFLSIHFTHQWARKREDYRIGEELYVTEADFDRIVSMYDNGGTSSLRMTKEITHLASCLHEGIWDGGRFIGAMCFETDEEAYPWTKAQKKLLKELVKIVPSFLMKAKADAVSQAKTDFLSRMSHEIRTPMNAISGMTTIAKSMLGDQKKTLECLDKIEAANTYLLELINDILDMSRIESGKMELNLEPVHIGQLMENLETLMRPQAEAKKLHFQVMNDFTDSRFLMGDSLRLNQVLINIIGNAVKFTKDGGSVAVHTQVLEKEPKACIRFSVKDTGIGIDHSALRRIFNAFEQAGKGTASQYGGTGLGLAISGSLVQMMGGSLDVTSKVGEGSEFSFVLSFEYAKICPEQVQNKKTPDRKAPRDFAGRRILLAEDNELNREIAGTILEMNGFQVVYAENGQEALEEYKKREAGYFDVVLMDIRMPVMDGLEAARKIRTLGRKDSRSVPIIALTANAFDEDTKKSIESGMNGHLSKPIQVDRLMDVLAESMEME